MVSFDPMDDLLNPVTPLGKLGKPGGRRFTKNFHKDFLDLSEIQRLQRHNNRELELMK